MTTNDRQPHQERTLVIIKPDGVQRGLPKHYEWVGAFGLLTTLVWLYIEMLRLLAKLRSE